MPGPNTAWQCTVCGYVHHGAAPPESCPVCGVSCEEFKEVPEGSSSLAERPGDATKGARVVVIGAGVAGIAATETFRAAAPDSEIALISREEELPYYRLNLTRYLAGDIKFARSAACPNPRSSLSKKVIVDLQQKGAKRWVWQARRPNEIS